MWKNNLHIKIMFQKYYPDTIIILKKVILLDLNNLYQKLE